MLDVSAHAPGRELSLRLGLNQWSREHMAGEDGFFHAGTGTDMGCWRDALERELMGEILPHVRAVYEAKRLTGWRYAAMYDHHELQSGRRQYYGTRFACTNGA